ncbi:uncharacterized protein LOC113859398 [Abrus precatorius]|uniref:Uncharacterized protein LOC113859398 n=1 Tax=Abrus precatorius TaxID=3816 RepID=A0A8B8KVL0_ABRPR|nr:uncharacterized protein LOC113859398 [Abrus precatorius]
MNFVYVLSGWEGSTSDSRVLRDAIARHNGFKVPTGSYYLVDVGYTNSRGFLAPYRGSCYHVQEWTQGNRAPRNSKESMDVDPLEESIDDGDQMLTVEGTINDVETIDCVDSNPEWNLWRDTLAHEMFKEWRSERTT